MAKLLFDLFADTMNGFNGWLFGPSGEEAGEFILGLIILALVVIAVWAVRTFGGPAASVPADPSDPHNGMNPYDVAFHKERGTLDDAMVIHTAARLNQQGSGRERGPTVPVTYVEGADYSTWRHAKWIKEHHPDKIRNPKDVPASDRERQQQIASGRKSAHYNSATGKWELD